MRNLVFIFFLCFSLHFVIAQQDSTQVTYHTGEIEAKTISVEQLAKYKEDSKFNYEITKVENTSWDTFKNWWYNLFRRFFEWLFGAEKAIGILASFFQVIPYLLLALLLFILIRFFIKANTRAILHAKQNKNLVSLSEEERIIKTEDIQQLIKEALKEKNYRLAIRYYYLYILKLLTEKELIDWQPQKTNDDYIKELKRTTLKLPFKSITRLYDYIWYGEFVIDENTYKKVETEFSTIQKSITQHD